MSAKKQVPAIEGWFTSGDEPHLIGTQCKGCNTYFFPREETYCRNPGCQSVEFAELREDQKDEDSLPPYEVLDDILESLVEGELSLDEIVERGHELELVKRIEHLLYIAEYKRRQAAAGLKVTTKAFGMGRRMVIAAKHEEQN